LKKDLDHANREIERLRAKMLGEPISDVEAALNQTFDGKQGQENEDHISSMK
jgi:hypothetical protein